MSDVAVRAHRIRGFNPLRSQNIYMDYVRTTSVVDTEFGKLN